jgi:hypothetical protein
MLCIISLNISRLNLSNTDNIIFIDNTLSIDCTTFIPIDYTIHVTICMYIQNRIFESSDSYKYAVTSYINCKDRCIFFIIRDIKYRKVILFIIGEYVSLKSMSILYVNPCVTSLVLYLTTLLFSFLSGINTYFNPIGKIHSFS